MGSLPCCQGGHMIAGCAYTGPDGGTAFLELCAMAATLGILLWMLRPRGKR